MDDIQPTAPQSSQGDFLRCGVNRPLGFYLLSKLLSKILVSAPNIFMVSSFPQQRWECLIPRPSEIPLKYFLFVSEPHSIHLEFFF